MEHPSTKHQSTHMSNSFAYTLCFQSPNRDSYVNVRIKDTLHQSILNNESMHTNPLQHMNIYSMHITTCKDHRCFVVDIYLINRLTFHINVDGFLCLIAQNSLHTIFQMANTHAKCTSSDPHTCIYTKPNPNQFHQSSSSTCVHALRFCTCVHSPKSTSKNFKIYNFQIRILSRFM